MKFDSSSRVLFFAPHPDDESLAAGGLLQKAAAAGANVRVIFATNGDDNPWPLRVIERQWKIEAHHRLLWGMRRMHEAREALQVLGHPPACADFLQLPDQRLTELFLQSDQQLIHRLAGVINEAQPTLIVAPSAFDTHSDHNAFHLLLNRAVELGGFSSIPRLYYSVHQRDYHGNYGRVVLPLSAAERETKRRAILCHHSQMALSRRRFLRHVLPFEEFWRAMPAREVDLLHPVSRGYLENATLRLRLQRRIRSATFARCTLLVAIESATGSHRWALRLPAFSKELAFEDAVSGMKIGCAQIRIRGRRAEVDLPLDSLGEIRSLHAKLEQPTIFYDCAGWREIPATQVAVTTPTPRRVLQNAASRARRKFLRPTTATAVR
ncbi:MAG: PIG-L family deacetylase [Verrucomicrobiota bacterium]|nr:PIG-L family deacetylase [Verrucomicrobiota bacterium]